MVGFSTLKGSDLDLNLGLGHTAYCRAALIDLYLDAKFHWNWRTFCGRTYRRTYVWTDGHL